MKCLHCGHDAEKCKEVMEERNRLYRFVFDIAERFADMGDTKEAVGELLEKWLEGELK